MERWSCRLLPAQLISGDGQALPLPRVQPQVSRMWARLKGWGSFFHLISDTFLFLAQRGCQVFFNLEQRLVRDVSRGGSSTYWLSVVRAESREGAQNTFSVLSSFVLVDMRTSPIPSSILLSSIHPFINVPIFQSSHPSLHPSIHYIFSPLISPSIHPCLRKLQVRPYTGPALC